MYLISIICWFILAVHIKKANGKIDIHCGTQQQMLGFNIPRVYWMSILPNSLSYVCLVEYAVMWCGDSSNPHAQQLERRYMLYCDVLCYLLIISWNGCRLRVVEVCLMHSRALVDVTTMFINRTYHFGHVMRCECFRLTKKNENLFRIRFWTYVTDRSNSCKDIYVFIIFLTLWVEI